MSLLCRHQCVWREPRLREEEQPPWGQWHQKGTVVDERRLGPYFSIPSVLPWPTQGAAWFSPVFPTFLPERAQGRA